MTKQERN